MAKYQDALICLKYLDNKMKDAKKEYDEVWTKLFGKPTSMFYGLKCPSKFKCISMIGDEYDISPDLVMLLQDLIIKGNRKHMMNGYIENYPMPIECFSKQWMGSGSYAMIEKTTTKNNQVHTSDALLKPQRVWCGDQYKPIILPRKYSRYYGDHHKRYCIEADGGITLGDLAYSPEYKWRTFKDWRYANTNIRSNLSICGKNQRGEKMYYNKVIDKKTLVRLCEEYTDKPIKKSWNKKQLYDHLIKYA